MSILYILIPISVLLFLLACVAFFWAVKRRQFSDLDLPADMVVFDDKAFREQRNDTID